MKRGNHASRKETKEKEKRGRKRVKSSRKLSISCRKEEKALPQKRRKKGPPSITSHEKKPPLPFGDNQGGRASSLRGVFRR